MLKIGIIGVGTVGQSVVNILKENKEIITARAGCEILPVIGVVKNLSKPRDVEILLTDNVDDILDDESIDLVVELMGGVDEAYEVVKKALSKGKAVVTANKALLAYHRYELQALAGNTPFEFEASVAGGIPIINALRDGLSANHIVSIWGILNGTCNYMLTKMVHEGAKYSDVLAEAQKLGYAEADPTFDVGGYDAAHKLLILASIAYGIDAKPEDMLIEGIQNISTEDIYFAKEFDYSLKLLAIAQKNSDNKIELRVHPAFIKNSDMIAKVDGVMNAISVLGDKVGETLYYGPGAGGNATASAVIANIIDIARRGKGSPMLGFMNPLENGLVLADSNQIQTKYYLRVNVEDKSGVLAKIATVFAEENISIESLLQKPCEDNSSTNLLLATHKIKEYSIKNAIEKISKFDFVNQKPFMIRIEEE